MALELPLKAALHFTLPWRHYMAKLQSTNQRPSRSARMSSKTLVALTSLRLAVPYLSSRCARAEHIPEISANMLRPTQRRARCRKITRILGIWSMLLSSSFSRSSARMANSTEFSGARFNSTRVGWVSDPDGRGTLNILVSCLSSLLLSSWVVMHLNIPRKQSSTTRRVATHFYWCIYGIFGPELVIWTAWRQLLSAWALRDELRNGGYADDKWTIAHGFYALMGGFAIDVDASTDPTVPSFADGIQRLSLTPKGVLLLAKCGRLPKISKEDIMDKSKVDALGKFLACLQVIWMTAQVCTRLSSQLPVTALEVTTVSHVTSALTLYVLWWHKPRSVDEPTILTGDWVRPLAAFMLMCSRESKGQMLPEFQLEEAQSEMAGLELIPSQEYQHQFTFVRKSNTYPECTVTSAVDRAFGNAVRPSEEIKDKSNSATKTRWKLARDAIQNYEAVRDLLRPPPNEHSRKYEIALATYPEMPAKCRVNVHVEEHDSTEAASFECEMQQLVSATASDWPHDGLLRTANGLWMGASLWLASIAYSGIHIAAWHNEFPTVLEAWLWRSASLYIACSGVLWAGLLVLAEFSARLWWIWYDVMSGDAPKGLTVAVSVTCCVCGLAYAFSRAYLIIEAFISLRLLPMSAYDVPQWTLGVPHVAAGFPESKRRVLSHAPRIVSHCSTSLITYDGSSSIIARARQRSQTPETCILYLGAPESLYQTHHDISVVNTTSLISHMAAPNQHGGFPSRQYNNTLNRPSGSGFAPSSTLPYAAPQASGPNPLGGGTQQQREAARLERERHERAERERRDAEASQALENLSEEQREEVNEAFSLFDLDKDEHIDYHELKVAFKALGFDLAKGEVLDILQTHGVSAATIHGAGGSKMPISQQQPTFTGPSRLLLPHLAFMHLAAQKIAVRDPREEILRAFELFDSNGTGLIRLEDLRRVARELGEGLQEEELRAMIDEFDVRGEGGINREDVGAGALVVLLHLSHDLDFASSLEHFSNKQETLREMSFDRNIFISYTIVSAICPVFGFEEHSTNVESGKPFQKWIATTELRNELLNTDHVCKYTINLALSAKSESKGMASISPVIMSATTTAEKTRRKKGQAWH
nr:centrin-3 [Quercus suber]